MAHLDKPEYELKAHMGYDLGWVLYGPADDQSDKDHHVLPDNDIYAHSLSRDCGCHPFDDLTSDDYVIHHNAIDGRSDFETGQRQHS